MVLRKADGLTNCGELEEIFDNDDNLGKQRSRYINPASFKKSIDNSNIYHGVGDSNCPKEFAWPRNRQHSPEKDEEGIDHGKESGGRQMVEHHHYVTELFPILASKVADRDEKQKESGLVLLEFFLRHRHLLGQRPYITFPLVLVGQALRARSSRLISEVVVAAGRRNTFPEQKSELELWLFPRHLVPGSGKKWAKHKDQDSGLKSIEYTTYRRPLMRKEWLKSAL